MNSPVFAVPLGGEPDAPLERAPAPPAADGFAAALGRALDDAGGTFAAAAVAERRFVEGRGGLQEMVVARAAADVTLAVAAAAASRTTQALSTILGMQV